MSGMLGGKGEDPFQNPTVQNGLAQYVAGSSTSGSALPRPAETAPVAIEKPILLAKTEPTGPTATETRAQQLVNAEQQRSERQRIEAIQRGLRLDTLERSRSRGFGLGQLLGRSVLGSG